MGVVARGFFLIWVGASMLSCGGGDKSEEEADDVTRKCADICDFWAGCNNRELEPGECLAHCRNVVGDVSESCFDLYSTMTDCQVENLSCADPLRTACESEQEAYQSCAADD